MAVNPAVTVTVDASHLVAVVERLEAEIRAAVALRAGVAPFVAPGAAQGLAVAAVAAGRTRKITRRALLGLAWRKG